MTINLAVTTRNAGLDAYETEIGTAPILEFWTGTKPANCAAADSGTKVGSITLPSDWLSNAASGVKSLLGTWAGAGVAPGGSAGHFRLYNSGHSACKMQGSVTATGGGGDMTLDNVVLADAQAVTVTSFALTSGNA